MAAEKPMSFIDRRPRSRQIVVGKVDPHNHTPEGREAHRKIVVYVGRKALEVK